MPTNYPGNPAAGAEGASPAPDPENAPIVTMPISGDAVVVAGVQQAWKTLADHVAFLKLRRAIASAWTQAGQRWQNARLQTRFFVDHMGFPDGRILHWQEDWTQFALDSKSANGNGVWKGRWFFDRGGDTAGLTISGQGAGASGGGGDAADSRTSNLLFATTTGSGTAAANGTIQEASASCVIDDDLSMAMQWDVQGNANGSLDTNQDSAMGIVTGSLVALTGAFPSLALFGAAFYRNHTSNNWQLYTKATGAGGSTITDSGVAVSGRQRLRIEYHGANNSDDSTHRVIFKINGVIPTGGNLNFNLTGAGGSSPTVVWPFFRHRGTNHNDWLMLGVAEFWATYWAGDVQE